MIRKRFAFLPSVCFLVLASGATVVAAQQNTPPVEPKIEKISEDILRVGNIRVDLKAREISTPGVVNRATVLEFVANAKGGFKAYESALELDTNAVGFNLALILIGLDRAHAVPAERHFDRRAPQGDAVEIWVEWQQDGSIRKVRGEELIYNTRTGESLPRGPWVYTGSVFLRDGRYLAEVHGVLIGFVHTPAPIIDNPLPDGVERYGSFQLNPRLQLKPGTPVQLIVKALPQAAR